MGIPMPTKPRPSRVAWPVFAVRMKWYKTNRYDGFADGRVYKVKFHKWLTAAQARSFRRGNYRSKPACF